MKEKLNRFMQLAEVYLAQDLDSKTHITKIILAKGVIIQMESDLILFEKQKGPTQKTIEQQERINILKSAINTFSDVSSNNNQIAYILHARNKESELQALKISELEKEIINLRKQLNFE